MKEFNMNNPFVVGNGTSSKFVRNTHLILPALF